MWQNIVKHDSRNERSQSVEAADRRRLDTVISRNERNRIVWKNEPKNNLGNREEIDLGTAIDLLRFERTELKRMQAPLDNWL